MKFLCLLALFIIFGVLNGCKEKASIHDTLSAKYSPEAFNYFYEVFFNYTVDRNRSIEKWNKDIFFFLEGDTLAGDREIVLKLSEQINEIGLPVCMSEAKSREEANLFISSDSRVGLQLDSTVYAITFKFPGGIIDSSRIVIKKETNINRAPILQHELLHALGFTSHVSTSSNTIMRSWTNGNEVLTKRDIIALKLLYEPVWPELYYKKDFERDFARELYHVNGKRKFLEFLKKEKISSTTIEEILCHGFHDYHDDSLNTPILMRLMSPLKVKMKGEVPPDLVCFVKKAIDEINSALKKPQVGYAKDTFPGETGIYFTFEHHPELPEDSIQVKYWSNIRHKLFTSRFKAISEAFVHIKHNRADGQLKMVTPSIIYRLLTLKSRYNSDEFEISGDQIRLKPRFKEILKVYTAPELPPNFSQNEMQEVLKEYEDYLALLQENNKPRQKRDL